MMIRCTFGKNILTSAVPVLSTGTKIITVYYVFQTGTTILLLLRLELELELQ